MSRPPLFVVIPVGPAAHHCLYLPDAMHSLAAQTVPPTGVMFVDDKHGLTENCIQSTAVDWTIHRPAWRLGVAGAFNAGIGACIGYPPIPALCLMMGADDMLAPTAIEAFWADWDAEERRGHHRHLRYWFYGVRYMSNGMVQTVPCNAAVVHTDLWEATGGFAPESAVGAPDTIWISQMLVHGKEVGVTFCAIAEGQPLYFYRDHDMTETRTHGEWFGLIHEARDLLTRTWTPPKWGHNR